MTTNVNINVALEIVLKYIKYKNSGYYHRLNDYTDYHRSVLNKSYNLKMKILDFGFLML